MRQFVACGTPTSRTRQLQEASRALADAARISDDRTAAENARTSLLLGSAVIGTIVRDPLLPEELAPVTPLVELIEQMKEFQGHALSCGSSYSKMDRKPDLASNALTRCRLRVTSTTLPNARASASDQLSFKSRCGTTTVDKRDRGRTLVEVDVDVDGPLAPGSLKVGLQGCLKPGCLARTAPSACSFCDGGLLRSRKGDGGD